MADSPRRSGAVADHSAADGPLELRTVTMTCSSPGDGDPGTGGDGARWARQDIFTALSMMGVGLAAAAASLENLRLLAVKCGWSEGAAWLLPVCLDLYGVTATRLWLRADTATEVRRWAAGSGWLAVALSVAGNALQHAIDLGYLKHGGHTVLWVVIAVAAVPPVMLALLVHVEAMHRRAGQKPPLSPAVGSEDAVPRAEPAKPARRDQVTVRRQRSSAGAKRAAVADALGRLGDDGRSAYALGQELAQAIGMHPQTATRYVRELRGEGPSRASNHLVPVGGSGECQQ